MSILKGKSSENYAKKFLLKQGLLLIEQNFFSAWGEIDLIMQDDQDLVFIEVRERSQSDFGDALESVDNQKQKHSLHLQ